MYDFIAIDFETANADMNSACSLGIACVSDFKIVDKKYFLIQPPQNRYLPYNTSIHGITPETTADSPTFDAVWNEIQELFHDCIVVAHNVRFDLSVLKSCLDTYTLHCNDFQYVDSIAISNWIINDKSIGQSLVERAEYFKIPITDHHNALSDFGKNIVLTGDLETMIRSVAMQRIVDVGGILKSGVSAKTDFLIVGKQDLTLVDESGMSGKEKKAYELIQKGAEIKILHEDEFLNLL